MGVEPAANQSLKLFFSITITVSNNKSFFTHFIHPLISFSLFLRKKKHTVTLNAGLDQSATNAKVKGYLKI